MPSSYTTRIRIEKQADGENPNSWGDILNQNVIDLLDDAVGAYVTIGTSGTQIVNDNSLTTNNGATDEARAATLELQGYVVSSSAANIVLPAVSKTYVVHNKVTQSSATGTLRIMNTGATATGFTVPTTTTGTSTFLIVTDGTNVRSLDTAGLGIPGGSGGGSVISRSVLTSIGEIETTTVDPVTSVTATGVSTFISNASVVEPTLLALSTTDIRYVNTSAGYTNTMAAENIVTGQTYSPLVTVAVSDTSIFAVDMTAGTNFIIHLSADSTLRQPDNMKVGQQGIIYVIQEQTSGGKTLSYANDFKFVSGTVPTITTGISAVDMLAYSVRSVATTVTAAVTVTTAFIDAVAIQNFTR
jgi:hypothetical protein